MLRHFDAIIDAPGTRYGRYVRLMDQPKALLKVRTERAGDKCEPMKIEDLIARRFETGDMFRKPRQGSSEEPNLGGKRFLA